MIGRAVAPAKATRLARQLGFDLIRRHISPEALARGIAVEREHGPRGPAGRVGAVVRGDKQFARIALAHLSEDPQYYLKLRAIEGEPGPWVLIKRTDLPSRGTSFAVD